MELCCDVEKLGHMVRFCTPFTVLTFGNPSLHTYKKVSGFVELVKRIDPYNFVLYVACLLFVLETHCCESPSKVSTILLFHKFYKVDHGFSPNP